ncbi:hypothetical protein K2634_004371 [Salmonella enterica subsp. enterica serovar Chester]|nr:hypothetical protein [Salmonella enterica subsp. enterica serovar Richmond]EHW4386175.1 hypothetical protein [Salmonella enterica subsp. enterica serovar Chester]EJN6737011.1 hypothetical protein [Salmonella enterica subsp. enterica serovar Anatum]ECD5634273.1 hypothetical protein [Salmonella enterica subsp. enterica serovar Richmond]EDH6535424.1 hypothetical protein [Salmonella enterica subsp. enterica serovar Richmond]
MIKSIFKYSAAALLMSSVTGKITLASSLAGAGVMMAQTTEPSVGHRTKTPFLGSDFQYNGEYGGYGLKKTPLPGFQIRIADWAWERDIDNDSYSAGEKIELFRSIYRVDSSGNETALEKDILIEYKKARTYNYLITEADVGSKLKIVYNWKSTSDSFTPLPKESYSQEFLTEVVSSPLVPVKPVLYVNGVERTDYTMYPGEIGYLRYRIVNRDGQPVWNITITDWGGSVVIGDAGRLELKSSTINMNGEVERKIIAHAVGGTASSDFSRLTFSPGAHYNGYNLWEGRSISLTLKERP